LSKLKQVSLVSDHWRKKHNVEPTQNIYIFYTDLYKPITNTAWVHARLCKLQKGCTRLAAASDKVYQLLAHGRWFSPGTPASSTTKTGCHDIAEILLKVAQSHPGTFDILTKESFKTMLSNFSLQHIIFEI
jgi:hypothetical protein